MVACKICLNQTRSIHDAQYGLNYYYCAGCEFIFLEESKLVSPDEERKLYEFHQNSFDNEGYVAMFRQFINKTILPCKGRIKAALDFGSGPGPVLAELLRQEGFQVDIYDKYFAPEPVHLNKKYDLITATEVFEHLRDPLATLRSLKPRLNPGGVIALMTLFHQNNEEYFKDWWYRRDETHISFYTPRTFEKLAELTGLNVLLKDPKNICVLGLSHQRRPKNQATFDTI